MTATDLIPRFDWKTQPAAWTLVCELAEEAIDRNTRAADLARRMTEWSGTRFVDWIDHIVLPAGDARATRLKEVGYARQLDEPGAVYRHPGGVFPAVRVGGRASIEVALKVEHVDDFARIHDVSLARIEGPAQGLYRRMTVSQENGVELAVVERHGYRGFEVSRPDPAAARSRAKHAEAFQSRRRAFDDDAEGFDHAEALIDAALADGLDAAVVCDLFFAAERAFWMGRNRAAQVQYARQQRLGLGWANHDHHTYRCARHNFTRLVAVWEKLGLVVRERFYAGAEAGWGAQVMEQPIAGIITFNDVDLSPEELCGDFAHVPLPTRDSLGTVGLWCALHGDSFLQAGMHHLECQFDFEALRDQLEREHAVKVMKPFTNEPHLRQAFTEGERWTVDPTRIARLLKAGLISPAQAEQFAAQGAIGSHLENLERNDGFKGFNQHGVSEIIAATDPRRHLAN